MVVGITRGVWSNLPWDDLDYYSLLPTQFVSIRPVFEGLQVTRYNTVCLISPSPVSPAKQVYNLCQLRRYHY